MTGRDDILAQTSCNRCEHNALVHEAVGKHACTIQECPCAYFVMPLRETSHYNFYQTITDPSKFVAETFDGSKIKFSDKPLGLREEVAQLNEDAVKAHSFDESLTKAAHDLFIEKVGNGDVTSVSDVAAEAVSELFIDKFGKGEIRTTSATGGMKGVKPQRYDLIPVEALEIMARLYGFGAEKYDAHNWRKGYDWSKSYASLMRHATQFWGGEDIDEETGLPHLAGVAFHAFTLIVFMQEHPDFDDRFKVPVTDG